MGRKGDFLRNLKGYLSKQSKPSLKTLGLILVLFVLAVDFMAGTELSISIFYLLSISLEAWLMNKGTGIFLSILSCAAALATDYTLIEVEGRGCEKKNCCIQRRRL